MFHSLFLLKLCSFHLLGIMAFHLSVFKKKNCSSCRMSVLLNNLTDSAKDLQEHLFNVNDYICKPNNVSYSVHELNKLHL